MEKLKIISIVTPSYNHATYIEETLRSVTGQSGAFLIDYIIMDGGSVDGTVEILRNYEEVICKNKDSKKLSGLTFYKGDLPGGKIACEGLSFRWISEGDGGQSDAINKGMRLAQGEIVAFLNSDDTYYPGALSRVMDHRWNSTDLVYGRGMWISREGRELLPYPTFKPTKHGFFFQCTLCQPTVFMKRETFDSLGEFSTEFNVIFDFEYWMRAVFSGMKFSYVNAYLATSRFYVENKTMAQKDTQVNELPLLLNKYYHKSPGILDKALRLQAKYTVHLQTVKAVNTLHELIQSDTRYEFK